MNRLVIGRARRPLAAMRWGGAATAAVALAALAAIGPPGAARAASGGDSYNQMTGIGTTASAITVDWTHGLLNAQNQPIATAGGELSPDSDREAYAANPASAASPLSFMYADFKNLVVTVSQTANITHQGVTVRWKGMQPTAGGSSPQTDFLQLMECYGDSGTGPSPEGCEYGSSGILGQNPYAGDRTSYLCPSGSVPSTDPGKTPDPVGFREPSQGCDAYEPTSENPSHCDPQGNALGDGCQQGLFYVPFVPVNDQANPVYGQTSLSQAFNEFNSNEVQSATTNSQGTGQQQFETLTNNEAPGLGCGALESDGKPRDCWLVIVPRGRYEPNGYQVSGSASPAGYIDTSPLSASNWAQRIQVHLGYAPLAANCPLDVQARGVEGTQVITRAMTSWQFALNTAARCGRIYTYTSAPETQATSDLTTSGSGIGMAFTTIPIGTEAAREGMPPPKLPKILYAPVAVTALDFGFNINERNAGNYTTPVNLTPRLVAKAITQAYRYDLPDFVGNSTLFPGPAWSRKNPLNITYDPAFRKLNPGLAPFDAGHPLAPLLVGDRSSDNQRLWQWIQSDAKTGSWLNGTPDASDPVTADPDYVKARLGKAPAADSYPQAYTGTITCGAIYPPSTCGPAAGAKLTNQYLLPVMDSFDSGAATVLSAADTAVDGEAFSTQAKAPNGDAGWWVQVGVEPPGQLFMWTASDTPDTAAYGLVPADLCGPSGGNCVAPGTASVTRALGSATTDSQGLLQVNPAKVPAGGYPLVDVVYAAVPVNQGAAALADYADLIQYAAGKGQTAGTAPGDLPPGYLPLPASLRARAQAMVRELRALAGPHPAHSPAPAQPGASTSPGSGAGAAGSGAATSTSGGPNPAAGPAPAKAGASGTPAPQGPVIVPPSAVLAGGTTPRQSPGAIRWVLIVVLITGAAGVLGGTLLRSGALPRLAAIPRWLNRMRM